MATLHIIVTTTYTYFHLTQGRRSAKLINLRHSIPTKPDQFAQNTTKFALATPAKNLTNKYMLTHM